MWGEDFDDKGKSWSRGRPADSSLGHISFNTLISFPNAKQPLSHRETRKWQSQAGDLLEFQEGKDQIQCCQFDVGLDQVSTRANICVLFGHWTSGKQRIWLCAVFANLKWRLQVLFWSGHGVGGYHFKAAGQGRRGLECGLAVWSGLDPLPLYLYLHLAAPSSVFAASQAPHWNSEYLVDKWSWFQWWLPQHCSQSPHCQVSTLLYNVQCTLSDRFVAQQIYQPHLRFITIWTQYISVTTLPCLNVCTWLSKCSFAKCSSYLLQCVLLRSSVIISVWWPYCVVWMF